jgi:hypothetical protein
VADWETSAAGLCSSGSWRKAATSERVQSTRESRISRPAVSVQRCATGSPSRWTTASAPVSATHGAHESGTDQPGNAYDYNLDPLVAPLPVLRSVISLNLLRLTFQQLPLGMVDLIAAPAQGSGGRGPVR